jgi:FMN phosphatase YigB (HAD superfamily)
MTDMIIFDVGGVLVRLEYGRVFTALERKSGKPGEQIKKEIAERKLERLRNLNKEKEYFAGLRQILGLQLSDDELTRITNLSLPAKTELVDLKRRLHEAGYTIGISSTLAPRTKEYLDQRWPEMLETWGGPRVFSYESGVLKPDPKAYERFTKTGASRIFYIEDNTTYLTHPVEKLGWTGILLTAYQDQSEPMKLVMDHAATSKNILLAQTPDDVERILREHSLQFAKAL